MLLGRSAMAKACRIIPLQPSPVSRANLRNLETSLQHYATSVNRTNTIKSAHSWPPSGNSSDRRSVSKAAIRSEEVIHIESDTDAELEPLASRNTSEHDNEVWADAYEYQEQMLLRPRLSQVTVGEDKENTAPRTRREDPAGRNTNRFQKDSAGIINSTYKAVTVDAAVSGNDCFARYSRQYAEIPCPIAHHPLQAEEFFTMQNNPTSHGHPPTVIYVTNENQLNSVIGLLQGPILSLDLEWLAWVKRTNISLIQISDANTVLLIQISRFPTFPTKLKAIIEDPKVVKCGVAIMGADMSRLRDVYNVWAQGVCELSFFARLVDREVHGPKNTLISLSNLAHQYLGSHLAKGPVRCSNWNAIPLSSEQRHYAAVDAYAGYLIFAQLERRRQSKAEFRNVWPPVTACPPKKTTTPAGDRARFQPKSLPKQQIREVSADYSAEDVVQSQVEADTFLTARKPIRRRTKQVVGTTKNRPNRHF